MHFLRWQWPTTAHGWEQAGFHYDSTLSYADRPGFRCGTCHAYPMFDPVAQRQLQLIQWSLIVMECSVIAERYLGLGYGPAALALIQQLQQSCCAVGGQFTLLWHNSHFARAEDRALYRQVVAGLGGGVSPQVKAASPSFEVLSASFMVVPFELRSHGCRSSAGGPVRQSHRGLCPPLTLVIW
jgi:hypothetical protein